MRDFLLKGETGEKLMDVVEMLKDTCIGDCTITLAGAHAKGLADEYSDIDIYMYFDAPKPYEEQKRIIEAFTGDYNARISKDHVSAAVGGFFCFRYKDIYMEVTTRTYEWAMERINNTLDGRFDIIPQGWCLNGYYTFTYVSEISCIKPLWDEVCFVENTKKRIYPYPQKLKKSIIEVFGGKMNHFASHWEYRINAIKRRDLFYVNHFVDHALLNAVQVIFALNETYYTGDKQIARKTAALPYCPAGFLENLEFLLGAPDDSDELERQHTVLCGIVEELNKKCATLSWDNI